jgi:hypothetical protein
MYKSEKEKQRFLYERERKIAGLRFDVGIAKLEKNKEKENEAQILLDKQLEYFYGKS